MKVAVTGSKGVVGQAFIQKAKSDYEIIELDLPDNDVGNLDHLIEATRGCDAIVHCAWATLKDNYTSGSIDPINDVMIFNVYQAAVTNKIPKVIMSSSNHAHNHDIRDTDGKIRASISPPIPDSPYGAEKVFMEALGRYYANDYGLQVVCIGIGNINIEDKPNDDEPRRYMSHRDLTQLVSKCLEQDVPNGFQIVYGVSKQPIFDWSNPFGYVPVDGTL